MNARTVIRITVAALAACLIPASLNAAAVAHWRLDEPVGTSGAGSVVDSQGIHDGTTVGPPTFGGAGANANTGTSASFPGTSHVDVPYHPALNPTSFTLTTWVYPTGGSGHRSAVTGRLDGSGRRGYMLYITPGNTWEFWTGNGAGAWPSLSGGAVAFNQWTHVAISFDAATSTKSITINGGTPTSTTAQGYAPNNLRDLHIGAGADAGNSYYFTGALDDIVLFDEALGQTAVQDVMDNSVPDPIIPVQAPYPTILKPVSVSTNIAGDAGSSHLYLLDDNPGFGADSLQRPAGTGVTLNTGDPLADALATVHERSGTAHAESWTRPTGSGNPEFVFDLTGGGDTPVESILLWQYGNGSPGNSARDFELIFHTEAEGNGFSFGTEPIEFAGTMDAASPFTTAANVAQLFSFAPETARYVGLRLANNYNGILGPGGDRYGLGEVRFVAPAVTVIPEPATMILATLALSGLGGYLRKRR